MALHLERELNRLQGSILELCGAVEDSVAKSLRALEQQDEILARQVIEDDNAIDQMEVRIEEEGLKILALHQPVAVDLRRIVAILKINNDLERIGDYAVNIAKRQLELSGRPAYPQEFRFDAMCAAINRQLRDSVDALVQMNADLARKVIEDDREIDRMNRGIVERLEQALSAGNMLAPVMLQIFSVSRSLERIGDHATNMAEDVLYLVTGEIVRHEKSAFRKEAISSK
ncbi:MAG: phosphate signaling complex protein PhoU [Kiritimatiellia bacterium]